MAAEAPSPRMTRATCTLCPPSPPGHRAGVPRVVRSGGGLRDGDAQRGAAVEDGDADPGIGGPAVEAARHEAPGRAASSTDPRGIPRADAPGGSVPARRRGLVQSCRRVERKRPTARGAAFPSAALGAMPPPRPGAAARSDHRLGSRRHRVGRDHRRRRPPPPCRDCPGHRRRRCPRPRSTGAVVRPNPYRAGGAASVLRRRSSVETSGTGQSSPARLSRLATVRLAERSFAGAADRTRPRFPIGTSLRRCPVRRPVGSGLAGSRVGAMDRVGTTCGPRDGPPPPALGPSVRLTRLRRDRTGPSASRGRAARSDDPAQGATAGRCGFRHTARPCRGSPKRLLAGVMHRGIRAP